MPYSPRCRSGNIRALRCSQREPSSGPGHSFRCRGPHQPDPLHLPHDSHHSIGDFGDGEGRAEPARTLGLTLTYVLGMATLYAFLGLLAGLSGSLFGAVSASPWALLGIGNLLLLFSLFMLDVFPFRCPGV